ncbi:MAG: nitrate- and nitrite sensing domain-containing protein [Campylobacterales bacterium]
MFQNISNQTKVLITTILLSLILVFIASLVIKPNFDKITMLKSLKDRISYSENISSLLTSIQKERGLSYAYLSSYDERFKTLMLEQRKDTNNKMQMLKIYKSKIKNIALKNDIQQNIKYIQNIINYRQKIDKHSISKKVLLKKYTNITQYLLSEIRSSINHSSIPKINQNILSFSSFLYMQENLGLMRAVGTALILDNQHTEKDFINFISYTSNFQEYEKTFLNISNPEIINNYKKLQNKPAYQNLILLKSKIISKNFDHLKSINWFNNITITINNFQFIISSIKFNTQIMIDQILQDIKYTFAVVSNLTILSLIAFILMIIAFLRLAREEQKLREVADKYIISSITDKKGRILDVSQAFCDISGFSKEDLIGKPHNVVRHPDMPKDVFRELWHKIQNGTPWSGKVKNLKKDGGYYWVYAHIEPLYNSKGEIDSYISIRLDITESEILQEKVKQEEHKNRLNQELMQQQSRLAQMGEMLSMIAHQWRQPLSAITATTNSLELKAKMGKLDNDSIEKSTQKIREFALHLSSTIDDFRNFFKPNKEKVVTDFEQIIDSVYSIIESTLVHKNIQIDIIKNSTIDLYTYEGELKQVILNLIKNAEDALIENDIEDPKITITIDANQLTVHDNAGGIPPYIMNKIFDPYFSTKLKKDGTGLGLYMSKTIIEEHCQGKIMVSNENGGAKFTIIIPSE